jgi:peptidoglycan/LPS O-acetylase OafA/YrhL
LYLLHVPVGGRIVNLGVRFADTTVEQIAVLTLALAASLGAAVLMHRFVEAPAQEWSRKVRYRRRDGSRALRSSSSLEGSAKVGVAHSAVVDIARGEL